MKRIYYKGSKYLIPNNFKYIAMDENGSVWCYENKPIKQGSGYFAQGNKLLCDRTGYDWENSLEKV